MKKINDSFICYPINLIICIVFDLLSFLLFLTIMLYGYSEIISNFTLLVSLILVFLAFVFFALTTFKFVNKFKIDDKYLYHIRFNKIINTFSIDSIRMVFEDPKYGYVNIHWRTSNKNRVLLGFEYNVKIGKLIKKYYKKDIEYRSVEYLEE